MKVILQMSVKQEVNLNCKDARYNEKTIVQFLNERDSNVVKCTENMNIDMFSAYQHGKHLDTGENFYLIKYENIVWLFYWDN